ERPHQAPGPAAAAQSSEHVVACLAPLAGDNADRARERGAEEALLALEQSFAVELAAQPLELHEQIALACHPQLGDREAEVRRRGRATRVVIAAAADDDPHAV